MVDYLIYIDLRNACQHYMYHTPLPNITNQRLMSAQQESEFREWENLARQMFTDERGFEKLGTLDRILLDKLRVGDRPFCVPSTRELDPSRTLYPTLIRTRTIPENPESRIWFT